MSTVCTPVSFPAPMAHILSGSQFQRDSSVCKARFKIFPTREAQLDFQLLLRLPTHADPAYYLSYFLHLPWTPTPRCQSGILYFPVSRCTMITNRHLGPLNACLFIAGLRYACHHACLEVRRNLQGSVLSFPPCRFQGSNSGCQPLWQASSSSKPSLSPAGT